MKSSRKDQLKSLKMPKQSMAEEEAGQDLAALGEEELPAEGEELPMDEEIPELSPVSALEDVSDDELVEEMKKRGLLEGEMDAEEGSELEVPAPAMKKMKA